MDSEYLSRPLLDNVTYIVTKNVVRVESPHTLWVKLERIQPLIKTELLNLYKEVYNLAKIKGISIGKRGCKKFIEDNWKEYKEEVSYYDSLFNQMVEAFSKVKQRGIHLGCVDDEVLNKALEIRNKYYEAFYRTSICGQMKEVECYLKELRERLISDNGSCIKIYI